MSSHGGRRSGRKTPPHSLRRVSVARRPSGGVRLASRSPSAPSTSSSAASPVRRRTLRRTGYMLYLRSPAPARRRRRAGGVRPVEDGYQAGHAGVCSAPHRHPHVAPRPATTLASEWVHMCRASCTCFATLTGAGPDQPLMGTVALFRMGKRLPVVEHHFCQHGAPRCGHGRGPAVFRPLRRARTAARQPVRAPG